MIITYDDFTNVDIRSGTIIKVEAFPEARKPAYKIWVDFGSEFGIKKTSAQVTDHYTPTTLLGLQIAGCVNLGTKRIAGFESEFLLLGFPNEHQQISLITPQPTVPNGQKLC